MRYDNKYGLQISLDELEEILKQAKNQAKLHNMTETLYFKGQKITQYCSYAECNPIEYGLVK